MHVQVYYMYLIQVIQGVGLWIWSEPIKPDEQENNLK